LLDFRDRNQVALSGPHLALTLLDFNHDPDVDALCLRLVENPSTDLGKEPREVRAALHASYRATRGVDGGTGSLSEACPEDANR
jgi:hypothetical protein